MAQRRMFSLSVVDTDKFLDMPQSAQALYFHLGMRADDDGFVSSPKKILKVTGAANDDLKLLIAKNYIIPFDNGVCVITDWKQNNYLQKDRYKETIYSTEKSLLQEEKTGSYTLCIHGGHGLETQGRLGKVSQGKESTGEGIPDATASPPCPYSDIVNLFNSSCISYPKITKLSDARKKAIKARLKQYSLDDFSRLFENAEASVFLKGQNNRNWSATFDWLIADKNMAKVLDGNYDNRENNPQPFSYGGEHGGDKDGLSL